MYLSLLDQDPEAKSRIPSDQEQEKPMVRQLEEKKPNCLFLDLNNI